MQKSHIVVICNQYTRWKNVKEQVLKLFQLISEVLLKDGTSKLVVHSIAFEMKDIFIHDGEDDYQLDELFIKDTSRLLDSLFESGQYWHQDTGSLIESSPNEEHFEKISLKSSKRDETIAIHLTHYQEIYFDNDAILKSFVESDAQKLSSDLETMHKGNKALLQEVLTKEMQEEIALNVEAG